MSGRKDMGAKLKESISAEDQSIDNRFEKADVALGSRKKKAKSKAAAEPTVVRDTFSMPKHDHELIRELRAQMTHEDGFPLNKSEVLRAGLHALKEMPAAERQKIAGSIETLKPGRKAS